MKIVALLLLVCQSLAFTCDHPRDDLTKLFCLVDTDSNSVIDLAELRHYLNHLDRDMGFKDGVASLFARLDVDRSGVIEYSDFISKFEALVPTRVGQDPQQVHLSLMSPTSMMVMWVTKDATPTTTVQWGTAKGSLGKTTTGSTHTYTAGGWVGVIHQVLLDSLPADTRFYYRVGDAKGGWSQVYNFLTPPSTPRTNTFAVYGDMGTAIPLGFEVCKQMERDMVDTPFDLMVHVGDIAYASTQFATPPDFLREEIAADEWVAPADGLRDNDGSGEEEFIWDLWFNQVEPLAAYVPYMAGVGNHEQFYNYSSYLARFRMPLPWGGPPNPPTAAKFYWSMDFGYVHFVFLSTEHDYNKGSAQYNWFVADLEAYNSNRANVPWLVVTGHRPMYSTDESELSAHMPGCALQTQLEPLFTQYKVDLYFAGHMHMYERVNPVRNGTAYQVHTKTYRAPNATIHVVQGTAGIFQDTSYLNPQPAWSAERMGKFGYGRFVVYNASYLTYEFRGLDGNVVLDNFSITR